MVLTFAPRPTRLRHHDFSGSFESYVKRKSHSYANLIPLVNSRHTFLRGISHKAGLDRSNLSLNRHKPVKHRNTRPLRFYYWKVRVRQNNIFWTLNKAIVALVTFACFSLFRIKTIIIVLIAQGWILIGRVCFLNKNNLDVKYSSLIFNSSTEWRLLSKIFE